MESEGPVTLAALTAEFAKLIDDCWRLLPGSTDAEFQSSQVAVLDAYIVRIKGFKYGAISQGVEPVANRLFHFQCFAQALRAYFQVWLSFKAERYSEAWGNLIDAYEYSAIAAKASDEQSNEILDQRLGEIERTLFPSFSVYLSSGFTQTIGKCSICGEPFGVCDHLENTVYMGRLCRRVDVQIIEMDHVSLVDDPRDRRCIIPEVENENGQMVNRFTQKVADDIPPSAESEEKGRSVRGVLMNFKTLDLN